MALIIIVLLRPFSLVTEKLIFLVPTNPKSNKTKLTAIESNYNRIFRDEFSGRSGGPHDSNMAISPTYSFTYPFPKI